MTVLDVRTVVATKWTNRGSGETHYTTYARDDPTVKVVWFGNTHLIVKSIQQASSVIPCVRAVPSGGVKHVRERLDRVLGSLPFTITGAYFSDSVGAAAVFDVSEGQRDSTRAVLIDTCRRTSLSRFAASTASTFSMHSFVREQYA